MNSKPKTYIITQGEETKSVEGRRAAVRTARRWSTRRRFKQVSVQREDQKVRMLFQKGELENYVLDLR